MTPKENAQSLIHKFTFSDIYFTDRKGGSMLNAKACAKIAVNELIEATLFGIEYDLYEGQYNENCKEYWQQVKTEIENL